MEAEISRLESALTVARDDLNACNLRLDGIRDELKHVERDIRRIEPDLRKVNSSSRQPPLTLIRVYF